MIKININETISYDIKNIQLNKNMLVVNNEQNDNIVVFVEDLKLQKFSLFKNNEKTRLICLELTAELNNSLADLKSNKIKPLSSAQINIILYSEPMEFHDINGLFILNLGKSGHIKIINGKLVDNNHEDITNEIIKRLNNFALEFDIIKETDNLEINYI